MYNRIATGIFDKILSDSITDEAKASICIYGLELIISYFCYMVIYLFVSAVTNTLLLSLGFFTGFALMRVVGGGFHASTYIKCHILFEITHLIYIAVVKCFNITFILNVFFIIALFCFTVVFLFSPVDNENKRLTDREKRHYKIKSRCYVTLICIVTIILSYIPCCYTVWLSFLIGSCFASISILIGTFQQWLLEIKRVEGKV